MSKQIINTDRLFLRPINNTDLNNVFLGLSNPDVIRYYGVSFETLEATKNQMLWYSQLEKKNTGKWWAICKKDSTFIGAIGIHDMDSSRTSAELGFWLLPDYWNKGYTSEALHVTLDHLFNYYNLSKIVASVESKNTACKAVLEKYQFKLNSNLSETEIKNGQEIFVEFYELLNTNK